MNGTRRAALHTLCGTAAAAAVALLGGCGFRLRGAPDFAFNSIYVAMPENSGLGNELKRQLAATGRVRVIREPAQINTAQIILDSLADQREKVVVALNAAGQVREFQLRVRFRFRVRTPGGRILLDNEEILQQNDVSFTETTALASEAQEQLLYRDMQSDVVQQMLRRLAALRL